MTMETQTQPVKEKTILTFSSLDCFRSCQQRYKIRYVDGLIPLQVDTDQLYFGTLVHRALEIWYGVKDSDALNAPQIVLQTIDEQCKNRNDNPEIKKMWMLAHAMLSTYMKRYEKEEFEVLEIEKVFDGVIFNPKTGAESKTFSIKGKIDLLVKMDDEFYIVDHKTRSTFEADWHEKLWMDTQMAVYVYFLRQQKYPIKGIIYNVLVKSKLEQKIGETEEEFKVRYAELCAKNKSGKSTATRQLPETDEQYMERLKEWYSVPERFQRAIIELPESRMEMIQEEIWTMTQMYLEAKRRDAWLRNTGSCYQFFRACDYMEYCKSNFDEKVKLELFGIADEVHQEFSEWSAD